MKEWRRLIREQSNSKRPARTRTDIKKQQQKQKIKEQREAVRAQQEAKREKIRAQTRDRVRKFRKKEKELKKQDKQVDDSSVHVSVGGGFKNRMSKKRATDKAKAALPSTPRKKAEVVETLVSSPRTRKILSRRGIVKTPEEQKEKSTLKAFVTDVAEGLNEIKRSGSNEKRAAYTAFKSLAFGDNVKKSRAKRSLGKLVGLNEKSISEAIKRQGRILKGDIKSWQYISRKVRRDALSEEDGKKIFQYWANVASRPTGDRKDMVKKQIGTKEYIRHAKHVLEKTQTEAFLKFQQLYPEVKVKQRKFESLKPFFVKQARERDRKSCLCRKHVEAQIVFSACMKFCKSVLKASENTTRNDCIVFNPFTRLTRFSGPMNFTSQRTKPLFRDSNRFKLKSLELAK